MTLSHSRWITVGVFLFLAASASSRAQTPREERRLPASELRILAGAYGVILESYVTPLDPAEVIKASIQGMLREIDPDHGEYLSESELRAFIKGVPAGTGSLGMEIQRQDGLLLVSPFAGGPAFQGGLRWGDQLRTVDGQPVGSRTVTQILALLRGPPGSGVLLGVYRPAEDHILNFAATRRVISSPAPTLTALPEHLRLLRLQNMDSEHLNIALRLLRDAWLSEKFSGLVIDLRGNQGGLVESSVELAAAFLPKGSVVAIESGRGPENNRTFRAVLEDYAKGVGPDPLSLLPQEVKDIPLVILIDGQTSSGAEIAVAALRDARRAKLVGRPTSGRGSIQTIRPIAGDGGAIKYTSGYWVSPQGRSIDRSPIQPDQYVERKDGEEDLANAVTEIKLLRKSGIAAGPGCPGWPETFERAGFPAAARDAGVTSGKLLVEFTLSTSGSVIDPHIVQSSNPLFDSYTIETARGVKCIGAESDLRVRFAVEYKLQ